MLRSMVYGSGAVSGYRLQERERVSVPFLVLGRFGMGPRVDDDRQEQPTRPG